ncbi:MAG: paraslipin [Deltaproteobacteria bacterium CG11_big_fil_rev_8_21_14_0_20_47_16]|nr:MAG: paraslipin [Deltaproteobacteria bacterium CG11_big_fil_rev_8_21_14_0_20_47_16]
MGITTSLVIIGFALIFLLRTVRIVPQQNAFVVERLGKYHRTLNAGLHIVVPFIDAIRYKHNLKEVVLDIPEQICITKDNVQVGVDGVLFFRVTDPAKASYGVANYAPAIVQLAQTTLRSEIGKLDLDRTFEERQHINNSIVLEIDKATDPWGVKVLRYEIKSITPPHDVIAAMEKQMRAEREKRAKILESEGDRDSKINRAEGEKQQVIKNSEASRQQKINEAEGQASAILAVAKATSDGLKMVSSVLAAPGGQDAARLRVAEEYVKQFGELAKESNTMIIPASVSEVSGMIATAMSVFEKTRIDRNATE